MIENQVRIGFDRFVALDWANYLMGDLSNENRPPTDGEAKWSNRSARAFGRDDGGIPVIPKRQARVSIGHNPWKFVLVSALDEYFSGVGIDWLWRDEFDEGQWNRPYHFEELAF